MLTLINWLWRVSFTRQGAPRNEASGTKAAIVIGATGRGRAAGATATLACLLGLIAVLSPTQSQGQNNAFEQPKPGSLLGSYLAGRYARARQDIDAAAVYYRYALRRDPGNARLLEPAFLMEASEGNWDEAVPLARRLVKRRKSHRVANLLLGLHNVKSNRLAAAETYFKAASSSPVGKLTGTLSRSWLRLAQGKAKRGLRLLSTLKRTDGGKYQVNYHGGLIADQAGLTKTAQTSLNRVYNMDRGSLRVAIAFARHAAHRGDRKRARAILLGHVRRRGGESNAVVTDMLAQLKTGKDIDLMVKSPAEGLAEVYYVLGEALIGVGAIPDGTIYLQLALYMKPSMPFALQALGKVYEATGKYERALATFDRVPSNSPLQASIAIRKALNMDRLDRPDEAKELLEKLAARAPNNLRPLSALGNIMRVRKRHGEAIKYYSKILKLIGKPTRKHWSFFYFRGTSYERSHNWPLAEADLKQALQLNPNQPQVLNYLGYSWVDQNLHLAKGMKLIEKAVRLKPDDGYFVDSLGWAHYRQKNYHKAVQYLERAVLLQPEDPVLNDHLGDALWRDGRQTEAGFQWNQALTLKPEAADEAKIRKKLLSGLPPAKQAKANTAEQQAH